MEELVIALLKLIFDSIFDRKPRGQAAWAPPPPRRAKARQPSQPSLPALVDWVEQGARGISSEGERCAAEEGNEHLGAALGVLGSELGRQADLLRASGERAAGTVMPTAQRLRAMADVLYAMASQRRDANRMLLLGDTDALAEACYRPIVDYCNGAGISLSFDRAATALGDSDLYVLLFESPTRLMPVVLPLSWPVDIGLWPALIHEIGHGFYRSVRALDGEIRSKYMLPKMGMLPAKPARLSDAEHRSALGAWLDEMFADAFGVMMLGPAFIRTMTWALGGSTREVITANPSKRQKGGYDEHPPAHVRVVLGCRLLARMGYSTEARHLEAGWRKRNGDPAEIWVPTLSGQWLRLPEDEVLSRAEPIAIGLYEDAFDALAGEPLRSIPGLDFGPREHRAAEEIAESLLEGEPLRTRDPRLLIAGAVEAWAQQPARGATILGAARAHTAAVDVSRRRLRLREEAAEIAEPAEAPSADILRDAILLDAILRRPRR